MGLRYLQLPVWKDFVICLAFYRLITHYFKTEALTFLFNGQQTESVLPSFCHTLEVLKRYLVRCEHKKKNLQNDKYKCISEILPI